MSRKRDLLRAFNIAVFLAAGLVCALSASAQGKDLIRISGETMVNGDRIDLGMISRINSDKVRGDRLRQITLGYSPGIGASRELFRPQIILAIKAAGFDEAEFSLETPSKILVRRASQDIDPGQIRDAVEKAILSKFNDPKISAEILRVDVPTELAVPVGPVEIRASISGVRSWIEKFPVPVEIRIDGKIYRTFSATAEVAAYSEVLVASNDLMVDKMVAPSDVRMQKVRLEKPLTSYLRDPSVLRGVQMIKPLEAGNPLTADAFAAAVVIKLGDTVKIDGSSGRIKISVMGEARANGRIGDRISVKNKQSGVILQATVVDEGLVKISI